VFVSQPRKQGLIPTNSDGSEILKLKLGCQLHVSNQCLNLKAQSRHTGDLPDFNSRKKIAKGDILVRIKVSPITSFILRHTQMVFLCKCNISSY
jgi:hypothetical protein